VARLVKSGLTPEVALKRIDDKLVAQDVSTEDLLAELRHRGALPAEGGGQ
jgi:hypothetical protein